MKPLQTHYDTLQVPRKAGDAALKAAFATLCEQYHPGKDPADLAGASPEMLALSEAYAVLSDSEKRFTYDLALTKRERELREEEEAKAAKAASMMFPPIVMPDLPEADAAPTPAPAVSRLPELPSAPMPAPLYKTAQRDAAPLAEKPTPEAPPVPTAALHARAKRKQADDDGFPPTQIDLTFADQSDPAPTRSRRDGAQAQPNPLRDKVPQAAGHPAVEWLRERPAALLGAVLLVVAVVALAPWMLRVVHVATADKPPVITSDIQPTYVEPQLAPAASAPATAAATLPTEVPLPAASDAVAALPGAVDAAAAAPPAAPVTAAAVAQADAAKAARNPKRVASNKVRPPAVTKAPEPVAPAKAPEPAPAPPPIDPGGHSGFAPKCRWVTPTKWSCD